MGYNLLFGLEIEMEYNEDYLNFPVANYHNAESIPFGNYFIAESDGSLNSTKFDCGGTAEIISLPFSLKHCDEVLNNFKDTVYRLAANSHNITVEQARQELRLGDLINFNNTTGCHVHVSVVKDSERQSRIRFRDRYYEFKGNLLNLRSFANFESLNKISINMCERVKAELPNLYPKWKPRFHRGYARVMDSATYKAIRYESHRDSRYYEWNFTNNFNTIELRSMHLYGAYTWANMFSLIKICLEEINKGILSEFEKDKSFSEDYEFNWSDIPVNLSRNEFGIITIRSIPSESIVPIVLFSSNRRRTYEILRGAV